MNQTTPLEVGIPVVDLEKMLTFYCDVLSCVEVRRADIPAELAQGLTTSNYSYVNVWLRAPFGEVIKLMSPQTPPEQVTPATFLSATTGISYLTFYCDDLTDVLAAAEKRGAVLRSDRSLISPGRPLRLCFFDDPEGNVIELVERAKQADYL